VPRDRVPFRHTLERGCSQCDAAADLASLSKTLARNRKSCTGVAATKGRLLVGFCCGHGHKMGFRFQRRLKLFPGVRLNFSGGGISTTIGVQGASVTLGPRGAYANLGIPGTGLSFRQRITQQPPKLHEVSSRRHGSALAGELGGRADPDMPAPLGTSESYEETSVAGAIRSGPVSTMTSAGLDELKKLINEAAVKRIELNAIVPVNEKALEDEQRRLRHARWFIVRLFTRRAIPRLAERVNRAESALAHSAAATHGLLCGD
jgi:hypothetical protein